MSKPLRWLKRNLSLLQWLRGYTPGDARGDLAAGMTVGVMLIPQAMAYALIAGLPPVYGLYASIVPLFIYALLGTSRQLAAGIVALDMLVVGSGLSRLDGLTSEEIAACAVALAMVVGIIHLAMGLIRLGFIVEMLSRPVTTGFMTAAPVLIAVSQVDSLLGIDVARGDYPLEPLLELFSAVSETHMPSLGIGAAAILVLLVLRKFVPRAPGALIVVAGGIALTATLGLEPRGVATVGEFPGGMPIFDIPWIALRHTRALLPTAITLALLQLIVAVSLGKELAEKGDRIRPNREMVALGAANFVGSVFGSVPVSASFSRTAVNVDAGARSPFANTVAGAVVAIGLAYAGPLFQLIPMPVLAAIILVAAIGMIAPRETKRLYDVRRSDGVVAVATFATTVGLGIQEGVLLGMSASLLWRLYRQSRPNVAVLGLDEATGHYRDRSEFPESSFRDLILILRIDASWTFTNAAYLRRTVLQRVRDAKRQLRVVIIDARGVNDIDTTGVEALTELVEELEAEEIELRLANLKARIRDTLERGELDDQLANVRLEETLEEAIAAVEATFVDDEEVLTPDEREDSSERDDSSGGRDGGGPKSRAGAEDAAVPSSERAATDAELGEPADVGPPLARAATAETEAEGVSSGAEDPEDPEKADGADLGP